MWKKQKMDMYICGLLDKYIDTSCKKACVI